MKKRYAFFFLLASSGFAYSQVCGNLDIQHRYDIPGTCFSELTMTMKHDRLGRPYLYIAVKEGGLWIYEVTDSPVLVKKISIASFDSLSVNNLSQSGNYLYLALGDNFTTDKKSGFAIVDVSDPANAFVTDFWDDPNYKGGAGIVETEGNYAYLGAMGNGLLIFDITDKNNIVFVSQYEPDLYFPDATPDTLKINARGMVVKNDIVYLCYDAGGFRIINVTNKNNPVETGRYSNPVMNGKPRAYNNLVVDDTLVYIAVDYCGMEILSIADTANVTLISWWNPWTCETNPFNWFSSDGHANEIFYDKNNSLVFLSTGKSDMYVVNVANPSLPDSCDIYGGVSNNIGTWGLSVYDSSIYLGYICTLGIPFSSNWTGVKILSYDNQPSTGLSEADANGKITVYPNPAKGYMNIQLPDFSSSGKIDILLIDVLGRTVSSQSVKTGDKTLHIDLPEQEGFYMLRVNVDGAIYSHKVISLP